MNKYLSWNHLLFFLVAAFNLYSNMVYSENAVDITQQVLILKNIGKKHSVEYTAIGGGESKDCTYYSFGFNHYRQLSIPEARKLLVAIVEDLINQFNESIDSDNENSSTVFSEKNFNIGLFLFESESKPIKRGDFSFCDSSLGIINYCKLGKNVFDSVLFEETYEEAVKIIEEEKTTG